MDILKKCRQWLKKGEQAKAQLKMNLYPRKVLLCICWDCIALIKPVNVIITADIYC